LQIYDYFLKLPSFSLFFLRNLHEMIIKNTANYSQNLPICVCSSRKFDKKMGKYAKIMKKNTKSM